MKPQHSLTDPGTPCFIAGRGTRGGVNHDEILLLLERERQKRDTIRERKRERDAIEGERESVECMRRASQILR